MLVHFGANHFHKFGDECLYRICNDESNKSFSSDVFLRPMFVLWPIVRCFENLILHPHMNSSGNEGSLKPSFFCSFRLLNGKTVLHGIIKADPLNICYWTAKLGGNIMLLQQVHFLQLLPVQEEENLQETVLTITEKAILQRTYWNQCSYLRPSVLQSSIWRKFGSLNFSQTLLEN